MSGKLPKQFRGGNLAEELGVLLLRSICAVAPIPRPDDIGIDALATLLRDDGEFLVAENSFFVQIKSTSRMIKYRASEINWLRALQIPFYIGLIDLKSASIKLYAALSTLCWILNGTENKETRVYFDKAAKGSDDIFRVSLRDANVVSWSIDDLRSKESTSRLYATLKSDVKREQDNIRNRPLGIVDQLTPKSFAEAVRTMKGHPGQIARILNEMRDSIWALAINCAFHDSQGREVVTELIRFGHRYAVDLDPKGILTKVISLGISIDKARPSPPRSLESSTE